VAWRVEYLDQKVADEVEALAVDVRASFARIVELILSQGLDAVGMPHVKHLEGRLWEMRPKGRDGIARAIYVKASGRRVVVVHAFVKKTQKTPPGALATARKRAKEVT
jgi:phage-related protein